MLAQYYLALDNYVYFMTIYVTMYDILMRKHCNKYMPIFHFRFLRKPE